MRRYVLQENELLSLIKNVLLSLAFLMAPYFFILPFGMNITLFDILLVILGGISLLSLFAKHKVKFKISGKDIMLLFFMGIFILTALTSSFRAPDIQAAVKGVISFIIIFVLLYLVMNHEINNQNVKNLLKVLCLGWIIFLSFNLIIYHDPALMHARRYTSFYNKAGTFAFTIAIVFPLVLNFSLDRMCHYVIRIVFAFGSLLSLFFIFISGSRGALIAVIISCFFLFSTLYKISLKNLIISFLLILSMFSIYHEFSKKYERNVIDRMFIRREGGLVEKNVASRIYYYKKVLEMSPELLVLGYGLNNGNLIMMNRFGSPHRPHNIFLCLWLEVGLLGLVAMLGIILLSLENSKNILFAKRKFVDDHRIYAAVYSSCIAFLTLSLFMTPSLHRTYWLFVALSYHLSVWRTMNGNFDLTWPSLMR
jgi:putative inorganic carbon (hco3(-)) transporter